MLKKINTCLATSFIAFVLITSVTLAQSFTPEGPLPVVEAGPVQTDAAACGEIEITQSASQALTGPLIACNISNIVLQNSYYRAFELSDFGINNDFDICAVAIGISQAIAPSGSQPLTVNLYISDPDFPNGTLTPIGTTSIQLTDQSFAIATIPVAGIAPAGSELVVEIFVPNGQAAGNTFFFGTNDDGQTGPSYIEAPDCGAFTPTPLSSVGFPPPLVMS
jgi:hypothetical protein